MSNLGRPLEFFTDKALVAAMDLFWRKGYEATSVTNLLVMMDLSKRSLYQTFGSKQQLFERCLTRCAELPSQKMAEELDEAKSGLSFIEHLSETIATTAQMPEVAKGCLMVNSANEFGQRDLTIPNSLNNSLQWFTDFFLEAVRRV